MYMVCELLCMIRACRTVFLLCAPFPQLRCTLFALVRNAVGSTHISVVYFKHRKICQHPEFSSVAPHPTT